MTKELEPITIDDSKKLIALEEIIKSGLDTFTEVGNALLQIRDEKLYRSEFRTFEAYCREKLGIERAHAYRLMDAAEVVENVKMSPIGDKIEPPKTESQTRPLASVPADICGKDIRKAIDTGMCRSPAGT